MNLASPLQCPIRASSFLASVMLTFVGVFLLDILFRAHHLYSGRLLDLYVIWLISTYYTGRVDDQIMPDPKFANNNMS